MNRLQTMARFSEPDDKEQKVIDYCLKCNDELIEGQEIITIEELPFCDTECLLSHSKQKVMEDD